MLRSSRRTTRGTLLVVALVAGGLLGAGEPASAAVSAVKGSAYGYSANIQLFGTQQPPAGPAPVATLASNASNSPQTASAATGSVAYGPATFFSSGQLDVSTQGATGAAGSVTSSTNIANVNTSQSEAFTATNVASSCNATGSGVSGSTTITGGTLETDSGDGTTAHPPVTVNVPANPTPNTTFEGHVHVNGVIDTFTYVFNEQVVNADGSITVYAAHEYLHGPSATGDLFIGKSECGVTGGADVSVDVGGLVSVAPRADASFNVSVRNDGPDAATGVTLVATVSKGASITSASFAPDPTGNGCTYLRKGKTAIGVSCPLGTIASQPGVPGAHVSVIIHVQAPRRGSVTLTATASSISTDADPADNSDSWTTTVA